MDPNDGTSVYENLQTINDAVAALKRVGRINDATTLINEASITATNKYAAIAEDTTRTQQYQAQQYAQAYVRTLQTLAPKIQAASRLASSGDQDDAERVFGVKGLSGDPASLTVSRRDAMDRVADLDRPEERQRLLASATRSGDEVLAHAIVQAAVETGDADTVNAFTADRPALADAAERLWNAQNANRFNASDLAIAMALGGLQPGPLGNKMPYEIDILARG